MIIHYDLKAEKHPILDELFDQGLYASIGVMRKLYKNPVRYLMNGGKLIIDREGYDIRSCVIVPKSEYFDWDIEYQDLRSTYGMLAFFTKSTYRGKGLANNLSKIIFSDNNHSYGGMNRIKRFVDVVNHKRIVGVD